MEDGEFIDGIYLYVGLSTDAQPLMDTPKNKTGSFLVPSEFFIMEWWTTMNDTDQGFKGTITRLD